jgi:DNA excision repair protein ERCC-3
LAADTGFPLLTGKTAQLERERCIRRFGNGRCAGAGAVAGGEFRSGFAGRRCADSGVRPVRFAAGRSATAGAGAAAQKDGRRARFYTLVSLRTCEEDFARHRQLFLTEQGYSYQIEVRS